jgi:hypothetical protein
MNANSKKQCLQNAEQLLTSQMKKVLGGKRIEDNDCTCRATCQVCQPGGQ